MLRLELKKERGGRKEKVLFPFLPIFVPVHRIEGEVNRLEEMARRLKGDESDYYSGIIFRTPFSYRTS